jgi:hypothetical protein
MSLKQGRRPRQKYSCPLFGENLSWIEHPRPDVCPIIYVRGEAVPIPNKPPVA